MRITDPAGRPLDAELHVDNNSAELRFSIVLDSAGGAASGDDRTRNPDYAAALRLLLERAGQLGAVLEDCHVESARTQHLPEDDRRIDPLPWAYPIDLQVIGDFESLRLALTGPQEHIGSAAVSGGNQRKRIRLFIRVPRLEIPERFLRFLGFIV